MLKRKIIDKLISWKNKYNKKSLIIEGMRQVGKTYIIDFFAKNNYKNYIYINFLLQPKYLSIFNDDLGYEAIKEKIKLFNEFKNIEFDNCLIFLDEIQECPNAIVSLKSFSLINDIDVIASGSYLGTKYKNVSSYPVGYVEYLKLNPLDFEEFLWANNVDEKLIDNIKKCYINLKPVNEIIHNQMIIWFNKYILVGGMPEVVNEYIKTNDFYKIRKVQSEILESFFYDISKYAPINEKQKIYEVFNSIPNQLTKENKKFMFSKVNPNARSKWYYGSISWLIDANIVNKCVNINALKLPLNGYELIDEYKIYMNDTGLLTNMIDENIISQIMNNEDCIFKGGIYENIISQILVTNGYKLRYFRRSETLEIDFIISKDNKLIPIEVKAGNNRSKSLITIINENNDLEGIKLTNKNLNIKNRIIHLPWYMFFLI